MDSQHLKRMELLIIFYIPLCKPILATRSRMWRLMQVLGGYHIIKNSVEQCVHKPYALFQLNWCSQHHKHILPEYERKSSWTIANAMLLIMLWIDRLSMLDAGSFLGHDSVHAKLVSCGRSFAGFVEDDNYHVAIPVIWKFLKIVLFQDISTFLSVENYVYCCASRVYVASSYWNWWR